LAQAFSSAWFLIAGFAFPYFLRLWLLAQPANVPTTNEIDVGTGFLRQCR